MRTVVSPAGPLTHSRLGKLSESEDIRLAQRGDAAAFERLYQLHARRVYSRCLRMTGNIAEAEDLTQEAFVQLFRKIKTFRGEAAFSAWLHRLAVNIVLMHLRKRSVKQTSLEQVDEHKHKDSAPKEIGIRDLLLAGVIDRMCLTDAIARLPGGYRSIFVLHDVEGFEHHEIAGQLKCSIGNSKSQLHKARMRLRQLLSYPAPELVRSKSELFSPVHNRPPARSKLRAGCRRPKRLKLFTSEL